MKAPATGEQPRTAQPSTTPVRSAGPVNHAVGHRAVAGLTSALATDATPQTAEYGYLYAQPVAGLQELLPTPEVPENNFLNSHYTPALYVPRPQEEKDFRNQLKNSLMIFIYGPWHSGKTWLLAHLINEYKKLNACIYVDCTNSYSEDSAFVTRDIASKIVYSIKKQDADLGMIASSAFERIWNSTANSISSEIKFRMLDFLEETLLSEQFKAWRRKGVILVFDHLERIHPQRSHEFCEMIRWILNSNPDHGQLLRPVLCSSTAIWALQSVSSIFVPSPPAHGSSTVIVKDFDTLQIRALFNTHKVTIGQEDLAAIAEWSGGDVGLLRIYLADEERTSRLVKEWIPDRSQQAVEEYLNGIFQAILIDQSLKQALCSIEIIPQRRVRLDDSNARKLKTAWIIRENKEGYFIRSQAYANFIRNLCKKHPK